MQRIKQLRNLKRLLCLLIAVILMCSTLPLGSVLAVESETQETEAQTGETQQEPETEPVGADSGKEEPETAGSAESEPKNNTDIEKYTNSISGLLWIDANEDGTYDAGEQPLADYPVYLYVEGDTDNAVQTVTTDANGTYRFEDISPGRYVVGIKAEENGTEYLLPLMGVQQDNKFYFAPDWSKVISNPIDIAADMVVTDIDAAMRMMPQIQPMANATYTIDINNPVVTGIPGVLFSSGTLTFTTSVDPTDTYIITGTGSATSNRIDVNTGAVNITLNEVRISNSVSPFRLLGTSSVNLTLSGTNVLTCTGTVTTTTNYQAGLHVNQGTELTIDGSGALQATGGQLAAGIGNSYVSGGYSATGTITITGGTVTATGGERGAGIGGGQLGAGGNITISGTADVTATGGGSGGLYGGAGIGSGNSSGSNGGSTITITGGGYTSGSGTINISGGTITARGTNTSYNCAGIGAGISATTSGTITISGGTVTATGGTAAAPGIGSYSKTSNLGAVIFTGGSIYPTDSAGTVSVYPAPTNGSTNGNNVVGMLTFTQFAGQDFSIVAGGTLSSYTYSGTGHAAAGYLWLTYPGVSTDAATNVTANSATMNGTYYMNGTTISSAYFEYGTSTSYGSTKTLTTPTNVTSGNIESVSDNLTGLSSNTTYHYRLVITVGSNTVPGNDMTFTTKPVVDTLTAAPTGSSTATISGTIAAGNASISDVIIIYATDAGFTANVVTLDGSSGVTFTDTTYTANITGLTSGQTYYVKVEAVGLGGTSDAKTGSFLAGGFPVTEKFVNLSGSAVDSTGLPDNTVIVTGSYTASGIPTSHTVSGDTYTYIGYKLDSYTAGDTLTSGTPLVLCQEKVQIKSGNFQTID